MMAYNGQVVFVSTTAAWWYTGGQQTTPSGARWRHAHAGHRQGTTNINPARCRHTLAPLRAKGELDSESNMMGLEAVIVWVCVLVQNRGIIVKFIPRPSGHV